MSVRLFEVNKVGVFCDKIDHVNEKRPGGEVKVLALTLRVQPFDSKLAGAVRNDVRVTLFKLNHPDPQAHLRRVDFALGLPRQTLEIFAAPDTTKAAIAFDHAKITGTYVRTEKNVNGYAFVFKATFGPVDKVELVFCERWRGTQQFVTFEEAEPSLEFEDEDDEEEDDEPAETRPGPMFDTEPDGTPLQAASDQEPARQLPRRDGKKSGKGRT